MYWRKLRQVKAGISGITALFRGQPVEPVHRTALSLLAPRFDKVSHFLSHTFYELSIKLSIQWNGFIVAFLGGGSKIKTNSTILLPYIIKADQFQILTFNRTFALGVGSIAILRRFNSSANAFHSFKQAARDFHTRSNSGLPPPRCGECHRWNRPGLTRPYSKYSMSSWRAPRDYKKDRVLSELPDGW